MFSLDSFAFWMFDIFIINDIVKSETGYKLKHVTSSKQNKDRTKRK